MADSKWVQSVFDLFTLLNKTETLKILSLTLLGGSLK